MGIDTLLRTGKILYEKKYLKGSKQLFQAIFKNEDSDTSASVLLDEYIESEYAVAYRDKDNQAHLRNYSPGSGTLYEVPVASEKTVIDEALRDEAVEGVGVTAGFGTAQMRKTDKIIGGHDLAHKMTKNKQAIDMLRTGVFYAKGINATDIGKNEDFARDAGNELTANFSSVSIDVALTAINAQLDAQGCPDGNRAVILGQSWRTELQTDTSVLTKMQANTANVLVEQTINPPIWNGIEGLRWIGRYLPAGSLSPLDLFGYNPGFPYKEKRGATGEPWIPANEAVAWSFDSPTWRVYRGVDVVNNGSIERAVGEVVFDDFVSNDPVAENLRSTTRHIFLFGNINHTVRSTGSNF